MAHLCRHIKPDGSKCGSPRLKDNQCCYFHFRLNGRLQAISISKPPAGSAGAVGGEDLRATAELDLPPLEDHHAVQIAIAMVVSAIALNKIDPVRARVLLYGFQLACANLRCSIVTISNPSSVSALVETQRDGDLALPD